MNKEPPYKDLDPDKETYYAVLTDADFHIGRLMKALNEMGLDEDTLVIFSSDNGPAHVPPALFVGSTGGMKGRKVDITQGGVNVPFIVRWPGRVNAGAIDSTSVLSAVDLLPTFAALAGKKLPVDYQPDGESFTAIFDNNLFKRSKPLFWDWRFPTQSASRPNGWVSGAVRDGNWKLLADENQERVELYNIYDDRFESKDLSQENPMKTKELLAMLEEWQEQLPKRGERIKE